MTTVKVIVKLQPECEKALEKWDLYPDYDSPAFPSGYPYVIVRDEEGTQVFEVSPTINVYDLNALLSYGRRQYSEGKEHGAQDVQYRLRAALGIEPL